MGVTSGSGVGPPTRPALAVHVAIVGLLALATLVLLGSRTSTSDCCLSVQFFGLFPLVAGMIALIALGAAAVFWRHGPLVIVETLASSLGAGFVATSELGRGSGLGLLPILAAGVAVTALVGAGVARLEVRKRSHERIFCTVALGLLVIAFLPVPLLAVAPVVVVIVVAWPSRTGIRSAPTRSGRCCGAGETARPGPTGGSRSSPRRSKRGGSEGAPRMPPPCWERDLR